MSKNNKNDSEGNGITDEYMFYPEAFSIVKSLKNDFDNKMNKKTLDNLIKQTELELSKKHQEELEKREQEILHKRRLLQQLKRQQRQQYGGDNNNNIKHNLSISSNKLNSKHIDILKQTKLKEEMELISYKSKLQKLKSELKELQKNQ